MIARGRSSRRFKAVFLDLYGTLLEAGQIEAAYQRLLAAHGCDASLEQVQECLAAARESVNSLPTGLAAGFAVDAGLAQARREAQATAFLDCAGVRSGYASCLAALHESWVSAELFPLFPDVIPALSGLKQSGFIVGAVSNWEPRLDQLCASHDIARHFDFMLASEAVGYAKPGSRLFEIALERAGLSAESALHAGDDIVNDIQPAVALGIAAVLVRRRGEGPPPHSPCIPTLEALLPLARADGWMRGRVVSGKREAAAFTRLEWVRTQVRERLGFEAYPGTLNLRLETVADRALWAELRARPGRPIEPEPGYCAARCYPASVEGRFPGAIVLPLVPGYADDVVEVIGPVCLRDALPADDGAVVTMAVQA